MGIISGLITYNLGKRRGRRDSENAGPTELRNGGLSWSDCAYYDECVSEGGCLSRDCHFPLDE